MRRPARASAYDLETLPRGGAESLARGVRDAARRRRASAPWTWSRRSPTEDLDRVHDPADEPAGLGPRATSRRSRTSGCASAQAGSIRCGPTWPWSTTPPRLRAPSRGDVPYLRRDDALRATWTRCASASLDGARTSTDAGPRSSGTWSSSTSTSTTRRCSRRCSSRSPACSRRQARARCRRPVAIPPGDVQRPGGAVPRSGDPGEGFAYDNERPRHVVDLDGLRDRRHAGDQRRLSPSSSRTAATTAGAVDARRLAAAARARAGERPAVLDRATAASAASSARAARPGAAGDARLLVRGRRLRALERRPPAHRGRVGDGRGPVAPHPWGDEPPGGQPRPARLRARRRPAGAARARGRLLGVDGQRLRAAIPASSPSRTPSTRRCSSARDYKVLRGGSWATRPSVARNTFRNWDLPERRQIFCRLPLRWTRDGRARRARRSGSTATSTTAARHAGRRRARRADPAAEGAAAQVLLRRSAAPSCSTASPRCPSTTRRAASARSSTATRRSRGVAPAPRSWSSSARARRRRRARCCTRWRAPGRCERYVPFDVDASVVEACADELTELYPGLDVHGVVGDFERDLERLPDGDRRLFAFLGGTIGNLYPAERARVPGARCASLMGPTRPARDRHRPRQGPRDARGRLQRQPRA